MNIGELIITEIVKQGMFTVAEPDPDETHLFVWSSGAAEQLEAVIGDRVQRLEAALREWQKWVDMGVEDFLPEWVQPVMRDAYDRTTELLKEGE